MAMTEIVQFPLYSIFPVGQEVIFVVSNDIVGNSAVSQVKYVAEVHISSTIVPNPSTTTDIIGTFKTIPNAQGVGIFELSPVIESFIKADNIASRFSEFKENEINAIADIPIHIIDKYSGGKNSIVYMVIKFMVQYTDSNGIVNTDGEVVSELLKPFNGYLKNTDVLALTDDSGLRYGYNISRFLLSGDLDEFLTNAPARSQYANIDDYGTIAILQSGQTLDRILLSYYSDDNTLLGSDTVYYNVANGGYTQFDTLVESDFLFFGCFPANLRGWDSEFKTLADAGTIQGGRIKITAFSAGQEGQISKSYVIFVNCPKLKGYEPIRLTWLNQWGAWDYYTFNMKSTKSISTKGSTYQQSEGTWNSSRYRINGYKGGKKTFRVNATEKISMNTDFVSEVESEWFEELINSPEVYVLKPFVSDVVYTALDSLSTYSTPVRLTTSSYTRKTVANDKLIQYTFEVEKSKTLRTQSI